jgi:hypothetical protein
VTTLLKNRSGSRRTVLPFLLSLVDGGDCAAHGFQIAESLQIGQSPWSEIEINPPGGNHIER